MPSAMSGFPSETNKLQTLLQAPLTSAICWACRQNCTPPLSQTSLFPSSRMRGTPPNDSGIEKARGGAAGAKPPKIKRHAKTQKKSVHFAEAPLPAKERKSGHGKHEKGYPPYRQTKRKGSRFLGGEGVSLSIPPPHAVEAVSSIAASPLLLSLSLSLEKEREREAIKGKRKAPKHHNLEIGSAELKKKKKKAQAL